MTRIEVSSGDAWLLRAVLHDDLPAASFPEARSMEWLDRQWSVQTPEVKREADGSLTLWTSDIDPDLTSEWGPAVLHLDGGSVIRSKATYMLSQRIPGGTEFKMQDWQWSGSAEPVAWVADLWAPGQTTGGNLDITTTGGRWSSGHHVLQGKAGRWYLIRNRSGRAPWRALIIGTSLERRWLWREFLTLSFATGGVVTAGEFTGLTSDGVAIAALTGGAAIHARGLPSSTSEFGPLVPPRAKDGNLAAIFDGAIRVWNDDNDKHMLRAFGGFRNACTMQMVDVQYRELHVALEAFAKSLVQGPSTLLVSDVAKWHEYVESQQQCIRDLASAGCADVLYKKIHDHAVTAPSGSHVERALAHHKLEVPQEYMVEVAGRNSSVHGYLLPSPVRGGRAEPWARLRALHTLLVVLVAKYIGYAGELAG